MAFSQVPIVSSSTMKARDIPEIKRPIAKFHPNIWKDHFLSLSSHDVKVDNDMEERAEQLKEEIRKILVACMAQPWDKLKLVDSIQQLGVSYHFESEINQILEQIYQAYNDFLSNDYGDDLNTVAIMFRLLRQQGYKISCDIFTKFTENNGKFKESLVNYARGILNLYEAAQMRVHGEEVLEEALDFTTRHLKVVAANSRSSFAAEVGNALIRPLRKTLPRVRAREYMVIYEQDPSHDHVLLTFSKLDFNLLQKLHQKELIEITRWWRNLDLSTSLTFARDRIVESYFWTLGVYFEPHFNVAREVLTKMIMMVTVLDDIYDAYATFEELQIFTAVMKRWDIRMANQLPEYMKIYYTALLDVYEEIDREISKDGESYRIHFAKEAMKKQAEFYFKEAEWLNKRYKPKFEEYLKVGSDSSAYAFCATSSFLGMGDIATKEVFEWTSECPKIIEASTIIARLMDDIVSHKFEREREHVASAVECYMEQYGCSKEETYVELNKLVLDAWKDINEACLHPTIVPMPILMRILNLSRVIDLLYFDEDGFTHANGRTKSFIKSMLLDPVPCSTVAD